MSHFKRADNSRRIDLIGKDVDGTITDGERAELRRLQEQCDAWLSVVAPRPFAELASLEEVVRKIETSR